MSRLDEIKERAARVSDESWVIECPDGDKEFIYCSREDIPRLIAEVERLRGLLADAALGVMDTVTAGRVCPFCCGRFDTPEPWSKYDRYKDRPHDDDCRGFNLDGSVK